MTSWIWALVGLLLGILATAVIERLRADARIGPLSVERDLLRERVVDLETSLSEDLETASLLAPLRDALGRVEHQVSTLERDRVEQFGSVQTVLRRVEGETAELGRATASLAGSLRSSTTRGAWGEVQLRRVLELAGMIAHCDFDEQVSAVSGHARRVRPDVVVRLPGDKLLVIDAKAPMTAFLQAQREDVDDAERADLLGEHATRVRAHAHALADKAYWTAFRDTPEMVVCFVPSDAMLATALSARPGLHEEALASRVVLVGPGSLLALLRTVAFTWRQESLTRSARELLELGQELYARLGTLGGHTAKMGRSLAASVEAYNALVGSLESRVLVTARRMADLGVVSDDLTSPSTVDSGPRVLTALELIDAATAPDRRPEMTFDEPTPSSGASDVVRDGRHAS